MVVFSSFFVFFALACLYLYLYIYLYFCFSFSPFIISIQRTHHLVCSTFPITFAWRQRTCVWGQDASRLVSKCDDQASPPCHLPNLIAAFLITSAILCLIRQSMHHFIVSRFSYLHFRSRPSSSLPSSDHSFHFKVIYCCHLFPALFAPFPRHPLHCSESVNTFHSNESFISFFFSFFFEGGAIWVCPRSFDSDLADRFFCCQQLLVLKWKNPDTQTLPVKNKFNDDQCMRLIFYLS